MLGRISAGRMELLSMEEMISPALGVTGSGECGGGPRDVGKSSGESPWQQGIGREELC